MTTSVRFSLSYNCFKGFYRLRWHYFTENITLSRTASWRYAPVTKCYVTCGHMIFMAWRYPLNNSGVKYMYIYIVKTQIRDDPWENLLQCLLFYMFFIFTSAFTDSCRISRFQDGVCYCNVKITWCLELQPQRISFRAVFRHNCPTIY